MSETCIVCLGDLGESDNILAPKAGVRVVKSPDDDHGRLVPIVSPTRTTCNDLDDGLIAHLLPCAHNLHNECLKPWVERANSCPICRRSFNQVDLCSRVGGKQPISQTFNTCNADGSFIGPVISSYAVADRTQIADLDPSMLQELVDEDEDPEDAPCPICGDDDNEDVLMECDGCGTYHHTYCVGLDSVPAGQWFCDTCEATRAIESVSPSEQRHRAAIQPVTRVQGESSTRVRNERRTRGQQRRMRNRAQATSSNWARVWQSVWDNLNLDLDFPFDEDNGATRELDRATRATSQRREFQQWERRLQVAERQGGSNRFRETAALLDLHANSRERPAVPEPESREEILAWNAFEKAQEIELDPTPKRKRKSATTSPVEPITEQLTESGRPLKRPRTRRNLDHIETSSNASHTSRRGSGEGPSSSRHPGAPATNGNGPSFLQSMLKEIETSSAPDESAGQSRLPNPIITNHSSPQPSSPGLSPTTSNHPTPRASSTTPPPQTGPRPSSPLSLTSKIEPIFPPAEFSPNRSPPESSTLAHRNHKTRQPRVLHQGSSPPPTSRSEDTSPTRSSNMPLSTKTDLQKMVSTALKPHYQNNSVNKDQYTDINRNVSHMLYDRYSDSNDSSDGGKEDSKEGWEKLASEEVAKAVKELKATT